MKLIITTEEVSGKNIKDCNPIEISIVQGYNNPKDGIILRCNRKLYMKFLKEYGK